MLWLFLGILSGLCQAFFAAISKKVLQKSDPFIVAFSYTIFSLPFLLITLLWLDLTPTNFTFWYATLISAILIAIGLLFFTKALCLTELSLAIPLLSFTPLFLIFTSKLILGEFPSSVGLWGILLIVTGAYILELRQERGILGPFKALRKNRGAQFMLLTAFIYSISSNFNKIAVQASNPITSLIFLHLTIALILFFLTCLKSERKLVKLRANFRNLCLIGLLAAIGMLAQMTAFNLTIVSYVISLKRTSGFFSVLLGFIFFRENNIKPKLLGASLMSAGVLLISLG